MVEVPTRQARVELHESSGVGSKGLDCGGQ